jgi:hypothetical protein
MLVAPTDPRWLFLKTCQDLVAKSRSGDAYDKLRMAGLLRQLLIGPHALLARVSAHAEEPIVFRFREPRIEDAERWEGPLGFDPSRKRMALGTLRDGDVEAFLEARVTFFGEWFSVRRLVELTDHVFGGAYELALEKPAPEVAEAFARAASIGGAGPLCVGLQEITQVALRGLLPLATLGESMPKRDATAKVEMPSPPPGCPFHKAG